MDQFHNTGQPDWDWWGRLWPTPGETLRELGLTTGDSLVEVGCGNGYFALPAARITDPEPVYALDCEASLLADLDSFAAQQGIENLVTVHGDARELDTHVPEPVDVALVANTFHGVDDRASFLRTIRAALTPGGRLLVVNWHDRPRGQTTVGDEPRGPPTELRLSPEATARAVEAETDFEATSRVELPPYHYGLVFE